MARWNVERLPTNKLTNTYSVVISWAYYISLREWNMLESTGYGSTWHRTEHYPHRHIHTHTHTHTTFNLLRPSERVMIPASKISSSKHRKEPINCSCISPFHYHISTRNNLHHGIASLNNLRICKNIWTDSLIMILAIIFGFISENSINSPSQFYL
jgi:hypothetical protein